MISEKLDRVMAAENSSAEKIADAQRRAAEIIAAAKCEADGIRESKRIAAKAKAREILDKTESECADISDSYRADAEAAAERLSKTAAKNEMFGMSAVIMKIIP